MAMKTRASRALIFAGSEALLAAGWSLVDADSLTANLYWVGLAGLLFIIAAYFWDEAVAYWRWRRGEPVLHIEMRIATLPRKVPAGEGLRFHRFVMMRDDHMQLSYGEYAWSDQDRNIDCSDEFGTTAERIAITNYWNEGLAQAQIIFQVVVNEFEKTDSGSRSGRKILDGEVEMNVDRISNDVNVPAIAFLMNETPHYVTMTIKAAKVRPLGGEMRSARVELDSLGGMISLAPAKRFEAILNADKTPVSASTAS